MSEKLNIGGQAVLEGVMMRSPHAFTVAVRKGGKPGADIGLLRELLPIGERFPLFKKKIIRGSVALFEALWLGIRALNFSANEAIENEGREEGGDQPPCHGRDDGPGDSRSPSGSSWRSPSCSRSCSARSSTRSREHALFNLTDGVLRVACSWAMCPASRS